MSWWEAWRSLIVFDVVLSVVNQVSTSSRASRTEQSTLSQFSTDGPRLNFHSDPTWVWVAKHVMEVLRSWPTVKQSVAYWYKYLSNQPMEKGQSQLLPLTHSRWIMQAGLESGLQRLGYWTPDMVEFSVNFGEWPYMLYAIHHATSCYRNIPQHTLMHWNHHVHEKACHCQQLVLVQVLAVKARNGLWRGCPSFESQWILAKRHEFKAWVKPVLMQRMDSLRASWSGTYILWGGSLVSLGRHSRAKPVWRKQHLQESYYVTMWWEIWIDTTNAW